MFDQRVTSKKYENNVVWQDGQCRYTFGGGAQALRIIGTKLSIIYRIRVIIKQKPTRAHFFFCILYATGLNFKE